MLDLPDELAAAAVRAANDFELFAPQEYVARMRPGDPSDPLLLQVLPRDAETTHTAGFLTDPVGDLAATVRPGLLRKYPGRALMVTTGVCAVHCRYCFRRHYPYSPGPRSIDQWEPALAELAADPTLEEVILSGGDPWVLVDQQLSQLADRLAEIPHLSRLRIHTRLPIVIPQRVTAGLIDTLKRTRLTPWVVVHANHVQELDLSVAKALAALVDAGIVVLNQTVLLAGVNNSFDAQWALCRRLVELRVIPYYLHQLDRVAGAAHFDTPLEHGRAIVEQLRQRLPGFAVPRLVQEIPGELSKTPLA